MVRRKLEERRSPTLAWLNQARDNQPGTDDWDSLEANRLSIIERLVKGKTFLDVGGMYRIAEEMSFAAERAGASRVVLFDGMDPSDEFVAKHKANDSKVEFVQGDLHDPSVIEWLGTFDVVWCTEVIYHTPHPMQQLMHLRRMTTGTLVLGTNVMPDLEGIEQVSVLYAGLSTEAQRTYAKFHGGPGQYPGMTSPFDEAPLMAYANMWFGVSPSALRSMLQLSGFYVVEEFRYTPFWMDIVATPGGVSQDVYPPLHQSGERVLARYVGTPDDQIPKWAAEQVKALRHP